MSVPPAAGQWIIQELASHRVSSPRFSSSYYDLRSLRIKDLVLLYKALGSFDFYDRKHGRCKSIHSASSKQGKVAVLRSYFYLEDTTTVDEPAMDELRNAPVIMQQTSNQQQEQQQQQQPQQQQQQSQQQQQHASHPQQRQQAQGSSTAAASHNPSTSSSDADFQFALRLQREEEEQHRMQQQARGGSQPFGSPPGSHALLNGNMFMPAPYFVPGTALLPYNPYNAPMPHQFTTAPAAMSHQASVQRQSTPPNRHGSTPFREKRSLTPARSSSSKKKQKTASSSKKRDSPTKPQTHNPAKVKAEPLSCVEEAELLDESIPHNDQERKLLGELKQMGFTDDLVILQGIRTCQEKSITQYMTSDTVMLYLVQRREEMDEAKKMDQARIDSERQRKLEAARLRAAAKEEALARTLAASLEEWKSSKDYFEKSWILNNQSAFSILRGAGEDIKTDLLKLLEIEANAEKWYGNGPQQYFQFNVAGNITSLNGNTQGLLDFFHAETRKIEHAMFTLDEQTKGGFPKLFLRAQHEHPPEDENIRITGVRVAAGPQINQIEIVL